LGQGFFVYIQRLRTTLFNDHDKNTCSTRVSKQRGGQPADSTGTDTQTESSTEKGATARPAMKNFLCLRVLRHAFNPPCLRDKLPICRKLLRPNQKDWNSPKVGAGEYGFPKHRRNKSIKLEPMLFAIE
jgi:hypothetical protein